MKIEAQPTESTNDPSDDDTKKKLLIIRRASDDKMLRLRSTSSALRDKKFQPVTRSLHCITEDDAAGLYH